MTEISSDQAIEIEQHFKASAGPGAGKTHWVISHVQNVLRLSSRLAKTAKIGCITFTNTGVKEIRERLGGFAGRVDVATIHSFLYTNIVKPYAFLLKDENGKNLINLQYIDGHEENVPSSNTIYLWKNRSRQQYLSDNKKIYECLIDLDWKFNEVDELILLPRRIWKLDIGERYPIRKDSLVEYKKLYWNNGQIHHEDVLYFAYRLITEHPELLDFIRSKYPYIFVDEFQDTHPIQTAIVRKIAEARTIVGVIGDPAQSIYRFQGAERQDFIKFTLPGMNEYFIRGNRRSTERIVQLLNKIRGDAIEQKCKRCVQGVTVKLLVGEKLEALRYVHAETDKLVVLARSNEVVGQIRNYSSEGVTELWDSSRVLDINYQRQILIYNTLYALELAFTSNWQEARREVNKLFRTYADGTSIPISKRREYSIALIQMLIERRNEYLEESVSCYNNYLHNFIKDRFGIKIGAKISPGKYKDFADQHTCKELIQSLRIKDDNNPVRTIHKAKGAEFSNVLVVFENEEELKYIVIPDTEAEEDDSRITYVALSRAKNKLYITVPELSNENKKVMQSFGVELVNF